MTMRPIEWARLYAATMPDAGSLRNMRRFAVADLAENARLRQMVVDAGGEEAAVKEWDPGFKEDYADSREAIKLIDARMAEMGWPL